MSERLILPGLPMEEETSTGMRCGLVNVPLNPDEPQGQRLLVWAAEYTPEGVTPGAAPVVLIPGGPGQALSGMARQATSTIADLFPGRRVVVFDPRGTGRSSRINCPEFFTTRDLTPQELTERGASCAQRLGPMRAFFTSHETVADLEAIRGALGIERWVPLGVSWGSVIATRYLREHPGVIERMIIDSTLPAGLPDLSDAAGASAIRHILDEVCGGGCPAGLNLRAAMEDMARDFDAGPVTVRVPDARGVMRPVTITRDQVTSLMYAGDMMPMIRPAILAPVAFSWQRGDRVPMAFVARILAGGGTPRDGADSTTVYFTTGCEEGLGASAGAQGMTGIDALAGMGPMGDVCRNWPTIATSRAESTPLPDVPLMILSGSADLRTPTENALALKALSPNARLLVVPGEGHSVISGASGCVGDHLTAFVTGAAAPDCVPQLPRTSVAGPWARHVRELVAPRGGVRALRHISGVASYVEDLGTPLVPVSGTGPVRYAPGLRAGSVRLDLRDRTMAMRGMRVLDGPAVHGIRQGAVARYRVGGVAAQVAHYSDFTMGNPMAPEDSFGVLRWQGREWEIEASPDGAPGRERFTPVSPTSCRGFRQAEAGGILMRAISGAADRLYATRTRPSAAQITAALGWSGGRTAVQIDSRGVRLQVSGADHRFTATLVWPEWRGRTAIGDMHITYCDAHTVGGIIRMGDAISISV